MLLRSSVAPMKGGAAPINGGGSQLRWRTITALSRPDDAAGLGGRVDGWAAVRERRQLKGLQVKPAARTIEHTFE